MEHITELKIVQDNDIYRVIGAILDLTPKELEVLKYLVTISNPQVLVFEVRDIEPQSLGCTMGTIRNYLTALKKKLAIVTTGYKGAYKLNVLLSVDSFNLKFNWKDAPVKPIKFPYKDYEYEAHEDTE